MYGALRSTCTGSKSTLGEDMTFVFAPKVCSSEVLDLSSIRCDYYLVMKVVYHKLQEGSLGFGHYSFV